MNGHLLVNMVIYGINEAVTWKKYGLYIYLLGLLIIRAACGSSRHCILNFLLLFLPLKYGAPLGQDLKSPLESSGKRLKSVIILNKSLDCKENYVQVAESSK